MFVRYVVPHGMLELSCITVCGRGRSALAGALIDPGALPRRVAAPRGRAARCCIVLGTAPWLVLAGTVEGFVTPGGCRSCGARGRRLARDALLEPRTCCAAAGHM